jgi:hypothetical protein
MDVNLKEKFVPLFLCLAIVQCWHRYNLPVESAKSAARAAQKEYFILTTLFLSTIVLQF